jgi:hypothetical protein
MNMQLTNGYTEEDLSEAMHILAMKSKEFDPLDFNPAQKILQNALMHLFHLFCDYKGNKDDKPWNGFDN